MFKKQLRRRKHNLKPGKKIKTKTYVLEYSSLKKAVSEANLTHITSADLRSTIGVKTPSLNEL